MQTVSIRRCSDGAIDIDSYRREARMLRAQAKIQVFQRAGRLARSFIGAADFAFYRKQDWRPSTLPQTNSRR